MQPGKSKNILFNIYYRSPLWSKIESAICSDVRIESDNMFRRPEPAPAPENTSSSVHMDLIYQIGLGVLCIVPVLVLLCGKKSKPKEIVITVKPNPKELSAAQKHAEKTTEKAAAEKSDSMKSIAEKAAGDAKVGILHQ